LLAFTAVPAVKPGSLSKLKVFSSPLSKCTATCHFLTDFIFCSILWPA
jgi:hypothetical protein